jgi:hypothetical protein
MIRKVLRMALVAILLGLAFFFLLPFYGQLSHIMAGFSCLLVMDETGLVKQLTVGGLTLWALLRLAWATRCVSVHI